MRIINTADLRPSDRFDPDTTSWIYNGLDCCVTAEVFEALRPQLDDQTARIYNLEMAMQGPVLDMNMHGVLIDQAELVEVGSNLNDQLEEIEHNLNRLLTEGYEVDMDWNSPKQLCQFLYDFLRLPVVRKRNAQGRMVPTSNRAALERLQDHLYAAPVCRHILTLRDIKKKLGFLATEIDPDGYMRCNFNIAGTNSGRMASSYSDFGTGTNLQNIDRLLKRLIIASRGNKLANLDLEQADSRNVGANCWNKFLASHGPEFAGAYLDACESGDLHTFVARMGWSEIDWGSDERAFRTVADQIAYRDHSYRDLAKVLGHGTNYYGQPPTMASHAKLPVRLAAEFQQRYFAAFPCIQLGHEWTARELKTYSQISTLMGRRRTFFADVRDEKTLREAIAFEGQGSTADEINDGMLRLWRGGRQFPGFQLLLQVHDSVTFEYAEECENEIIPWAIETLRVPLELAGGRKFVVPTEAKVGWNWGDYEDGSNLDKRGKPRRKNLDGMRKWKGGDSRQRLQEPRLRAF